MDRSRSVCSRAAGSLGWQVGHRRRELELRLQPHPAPTPRPHADARVGKAMRITEGSGYAHGPLRQFNRLLVVASIDHSWPNPRIALMMPPGSSSSRAIRRLSVSNSTLARLSVRLASRPAACSAAARATCDAWLLETATASRLVVRIRPIADARKRVRRARRVRSGRRNAPRGAEPPGGPSVSDAARILLRVAKSAARMPGQAVPGPAALNSFCGTR